MVRFLEQPNDDVSAVWGGVSGLLIHQLDLQAALDAKQTTLVSATNIKTINGESILGAGDLTIASGVAIGDTVTSATAGSILFAGAGGVLAQDNANLFYDDANNRLAIGTTTPSNALEVFGTTSAGGISSNIGYNIQPVTAPGAATATAVAGSGLEIGQYFYRIAYYNAIGDTDTPSSVGVTTTSGNQQVNLTNIPVSSDLSVIGRRIFRSKLGDGSSYGFLVATIANNTATTHSDTFPDASMTGTQASRSIYQKPNLSTGYISVNGIRSMVVDKNITVFGYTAGQNLTQSAGGSTLFGAYAGQNITTGSSNTYIGHTAGAASTTGSDSVGLGFEALRYGTTFTRNIAIGRATLKNNNNSENVAIGYFTGTNSTGTGNVFIGGTNTRGKTSGNFNVIIGNNAGGAITTTSSSTILLGNYAGAYETASNVLIIDSINRANEAASRTGALIYGVTSATVANQILSLGGGGKVGIGTIALTATLDILDTTLAGSGSLAGSILNLAQTWNTSGTPTAIKLNVTDTASNASSLLMDLQVGGSSKIKIDKSGVVTTTAPVILKGYTVATLPTPVVGMTAYCTDLTTPTYLAIAVGGGAVVGKVFYNGTNWIT